MGACTRSPGRAGHARALGEEGRQYWYTHTYARELREHFNASLAHMHSHSEPA